MYWCIVHSTVNDYIQYIRTYSTYPFLLYQHLRDKFWNFVFYKFIFVFGVMDVQDLGDILGWCMWFAALGFFLLISELAKDRFEYVSQGTT